MKVMHLFPVMLFTTEKAKKKGGGGGEGVALEVLKYDLCTMVN